MTDEGLRAAAFEAVQAWVLDLDSEEAMADLEAALARALGLTNPSLNDMERALRAPAPDRADLDVERLALLLARIIAFPDDGTLAREEAERIAREYAAIATPDRERET